MRIQQTYNFILVLQTFIIFSSLIAIIWAVLINCNYIPFLLLLLISIFIFVSIYISKNEDKNFSINKKTCLLSIFIIWIILPVMGTIPLYIIFPDEKLRDIIFLSISLVTTNGIWTEIAYINKPEFLIWQAILQWLGGLCTVLIGSFFVEKVLRKKSISTDYFSLENVKIIFFLYISITIIFTILFKLISMTWDDALRISMALISTSNGFYSDGQVIVESNIINKVIMICAMIFGSLSVNLHYKSFTHGFFSYLKNKNIKLALIFLFTIVLFLITFILNNIKMPFMDKFIDACFVIVSFITTTGFIPNHLYDYGILSNMLLLLAMLTLIGGSVSSTTGGLKPTRIIYISRYISTELFRLGNPRKILAKEKFNSIDEISQIFIFCILYLVFIPFSAAILSIFNANFEEAFFIVISALTNSGIGLIEISNISYYPNSIMEIIILSIILLCGRIEIFLTMIFLSSFFWRNN